MDCAGTIVGQVYDPAPPAPECQLLADPLMSDVSLLTSFCQDGCFPGTDKVLSIRSPHMQLHSFQNIGLDLSAYGGNPSAAYGGNPSPTYSSNPSPAYGGNPPPTYRGNPSPVYSGIPSPAGRHGTLHQPDAGSRAPALAAALMCMPPISNTAGAPLQKRAYVDSFQTAAHPSYSPSTINSDSGTSICFTLRPSPMKVISLHCLWQLLSSCSW